MAGPMPPAPMGGQVVPFPGGMGMSQPMMPNPAFQQWQQMAQAWQQEQQQRQQTFLKACEFIKEDAHKRYNIDIEADSTIAADEDAEKAARTQFLQAITPFLTMAIPQMQQNPAIAPLLGQLIMFTVRAFPVSRQLDDAFEDAIEKLEHMAQTMGPPPPQQKGNTKSPMEIQTEAAIAKGEQQTDLQVQQMRSQTDAAKEQAAQQANAIKLMQLFQQSQEGQARLAQESQQHSAEMSLRAREVAGREALEQARMTRIENQNTAGLV